LPVTLVCMTALAVVAVIAAAWVSTSQTSDLMSFTVAPPGTHYLIQQPQYVVQQPVVQSQPNPLVIVHPDANVLAPSGNFRVHFHRRPRARGGLLKKVTKDIHKLRRVVERLSRRLRPRRSRRSRRRRSVMSRVSTTSPTTFTIVVPKRATIKQGKAVVLAPRGQQRPPRRRPRYRRRYRVPGNAEMERNLERIFSDVGREPRRRRTRKLPKFPRGVRKQHSRHQSRRGPRMSVKKLCTGPMCGPLKVKNPPRNGWLSTYWIEGNTMAIRWQGGGPGSNTTVQLYRARKFVKTLVKSKPNSGVLRWHVPALPPSSRYRIRIVTQEKPKKKRVKVLVSKKGQPKKYKMKRMKVPGKLHIAYSGMMSLEPASRVGHRWRKRWWRQQGSPRKDGPDYDRMM